jgi:hypothetical protein
VQFPVDQELGVPAEVAFDLLADLRKQRHWSSAPIEGELQTGEPIGVDSRFVAEQGGRSYEATITAYDRPGLLRIEVLGAHLTVKGEFRFTPSGRGAQLDGTVDITAKGAMRLGLPAFRGRIAAELPKEAERFAQYCEAHAG